MAKFVVTEEVETLSFDFRPFVDIEGDIPEPSSKQIKDFKQTFQRLMAAATPAGDAPKASTPEEAMRIFAEQTDEERAALMERGEALESLLVQAVVDVCSGAFTVEQFNRLPYRASAAFTGWVLGQFVAPKA